MKHTEQSLLREIRQIQKELKFVNLRKEALSSALLSESLTDTLVDVIFGPFLHLSALNLRNTKEWKDTQEKIKELTKKSDALMAKGKKLQAEYDKMMADKYQKRKPNTKPFKPTKSL